MIGARQNLTRLREGQVMSNKKILIVDDQSYNCDVLYSILMGHELYDAEARIEICLSGKEALNMLKQGIEEDDKGISC